MSINSILRFLIINVFLLIAKIMFMFQKEVFLIAFMQISNLMTKYQRKNHMICFHTIFKVLYTIWLKRF